MKNVPARAPKPRKKPQRVSVADAKARLSSLIREAAKRPTVIHNRGRDVAVLMSIVDYEKASIIASVQPESKAEKFLREASALRDKLGGFEDDFSPEPLDLRAQAVQF